MHNTAAENPSIAITALAQNALRHLAVVKLNRAVAQNLLRFVPFARKQHDVAGTRLIQRHFDGLLPVQLHEQLRLGALHAHNHVIDDQQRVFAPRIVRRQHDDFARAARRLSHQRTLGAVAIPAAAEQSDDAAIGIEFPRSGQQVAQRVIGVRVIHDHEERLSHFDTLEAAGHGCKLRNARRR